MNHGDVFVLDSGKKIFVWRGAEASGSEKMTAGLIAAKFVFQILEKRSFPKIKNQHYFMLG